MESIDGKALKKFIQSLYASCHHFMCHYSKFLFTLIEHCQFHTAVQIFRSLHNFSSLFTWHVQFSRNVTGHLSRNINWLFVPRVAERSFYNWRTVAIVKQLKVLWCWGCHFVFILKLLFMCFVFVYCICLYFMFDQGSTENQFYWVDFLMKDYNYNLYSRWANRWQVCTIHVIASVLILCCAVCGEKLNNKCMPLVY